MPPRYVKPALHGSLFLFDKSKIIQVFELRKQYSKYFEKYFYPAFSRPIPLAHLDKFIFTVF